MGKLTWASWQKLGMWIWYTSLFPLLFIFTFLDDKDPFDWETAWKFTRTLSLSYILSSAVQRILLHDSRCLDKFVPSIRVLCKIRSKFCKPFQKNCELYIIWYFLKTQGQMSTIWADLESKRSQEANLKKKKERGSFYAKIRVEQKCQTSKNLL